MTIKLNYRDIFVTNIVLHQLRMISKTFIQVTLIYCDFSYAEMISYTTMDSNFVFLDRFPFLSYRAKTHTHTHIQRERERDSNEYS